MFSTFINHIAKCCCALLFLVITLPVYATPQTAAANTEREAALKLLQSKQYPEAAKAWKQFLNNANNKNDAEAWMYFGTALYRSNKLGEAKDALEKAVRLNSNLDIAHVYYAYTLLALDQTKEAEKEITIALTLSPKNIEALTFRAKLNHLKSSYAESLADYDSLIQLLPDYPLPYLSKAEILLEQLYLKNGRKAFQFFKTGVGDFPEEWRTIFRQSAQLIEKYLQLNPTDKNSEFWRERIHTLKYYGERTAPLACETATSKLHPKVTYQEPSTYTEEARQRKINGTVMLKAEFDVDGKIKHVIPATYLKGGLTNQAIKTAQLMRFNPAMKNGIPSCVVMAIEFQFDLF